MAETENAQSLVSRREDRRQAQQEAQANQPDDLSMTDVGAFVAEATPILGDAMAAREVYDELQKDDPNYTLVGALGGAALIGLIPGIGDAAASAIRRGSRRLLGQTDEAVGVATRTSNTPSFSEESALEADQLIFSWEKGEMTNSELRQAMRDRGFEIQTKRISPNMSGEELEVVYPGSDEIVRWKDIPHGYAEGGMAMDKEMNDILKEEGGLTDDGMERDPVSGNEVPPGSMAEEVRDDIDARLSGGEYVVPADVVRYYGVKFFEDLRGEAKMGLNHMEQTGRIGGEPVEMNTGGMVQASNFNLGIPSAQTPAQPPEQGYAPGGYVNTSAGIAQNLAQGLTATGQQQTSSIIPTTTPNTPSYINEDGTVNFDQLVGQSAQNMFLQTPYSSLADLFADFSQVGNYTQRMREGAPAPSAIPSGMLEYIAYVGPNGEIMMIPFLNGEPQVKIPEGYTQQGSTGTEEAVQTPTVQTPTGPSGDGDNSDSRVATSSGGESFEGLAQSAYDKFSNAEDLEATMLEAISTTPTGLDLVPGLIGAGVRTAETLSDIAQARGYAMHIMETDPERGQALFDAVDEAIDGASFGVRALEGIIASGNMYKNRFDEIAAEGGTTPPPAVTASTRGVTPPAAAGSTKPPKESTPTFTLGEITYGGKPSDPNKGGQSDSGGGMGVDYGGGTGGSSKGTSGSSSGKSTSSSSSGKSSSSSSGKSSSSSSGKSSSSSSSKSQPEDKGFGKAEGGLIERPKRTRSKRTNTKK